MKSYLGTLAAWLVLLSCGFGQEVVLSTYVGGAKTDALLGAAVLPDGSAVVGGMVDAARGGDKNDKLEGGQGLVQVLSKAGEFVAERRYPAAVNDLATDSEGNVYLTGAMGTIKLDSSLHKTIWESKVGSAQARVCPGPQGGAVVLADRRVTLLDGTGNVARSFPISGGFVEDVAFHPKLG